MKYNDNSFVLKYRSVKWSLSRYKRRESFPDLYNYKTTDSNSAEEVSESFHWVLDLKDFASDKNEDDIVKKRRNFAITRSKSFAQPVNSERRPLRRSCLNENRRPKEKKSLVFGPTEVAPSYDEVQSVESLIQVRQQTSLGLDQIRFYCSTE